MAGGNDTRASSDGRPGIVCPSRETGASPSPVAGGRTLLECAVSLALRGLKVIPLPPRKKKPATENGYKNATSDLTKIIKWWSENPCYNIGVKAGDGLVVIDVDVDEEKGEDGFSELMAWVSEHGELPRTFTVRTGRGGVHLYYYIDREIRNTVNAELGIDIRGDGGYVVGPQSIHPNGNVYVAQEPIETMEIARADDNVYALIEHVRTYRRARRPQAASSGRCASGRFELPAQIVEGERHDTLVRYAGSLVGRGYPEEAVADAIRLANQARCVPPSPEDEVEELIKWSRTLPRGRAWHEGSSCEGERYVPTEDDVVPTEAYTEAGWAEPASPEGEAAPDEDSQKDTRTSDDEVLALAADDATFLRLHAGDTSSHRGKGAARQHLMDRLAFWCRRDEDQMVRLYLASAMHEKESDGLVRAMAREACRKAPAIFDERLGSIRTATLDKGLRMPSAPFWDSDGSIQLNLLADVIRRDWHARTIDGSMALWSDGRWDFDTKAIDGAIFSYVDDLEIKHRKEVAAFITDDRRRLRATESARDYDGHAYVQFENGTFRVTADAVEPVEPEPSMLVVGRIPVSYHETEANEMDGFLDSIACGDGPTRAVLEEVAGSCLTARHATSQAVVLTGESGAGGSVDASNGKSTYVSVLRSLVGTENVTSINPQVLGGRFQASRLIGKLAVFADETNRDAFEGGQNATFKSLVSGNTLHTDIKHKDGTDFCPLATVVVSLNGSLSVSDLDGGLRRRLTFVPFRAHFVEGEPGCNPNLANELSRNKGAMQRLAYLGVRGLQRLLRQGHYTRIERSDEILERVRLEGNPVAAWVYEASVDYARDINLKPSGDVYATFRLWGEQSGYEKLPSINVFRRMLAADDGIVSSIERAMRDGRLRPKRHWRITTEPIYVPSLGKVARIYRLV